MAIMDVSDDSFEQDVLHSSQFVVVDFWAQWCGPCRTFLPILEEVSARMQDKVKFVKINIDENPMVPSRYGVRSIPTLLLIKDGNIVASKVGMISINTLTEWIRSHT